MIVVHFWVSVVRWIYPVVAVLNFSSALFYHSYHDVFWNQELQHRKQIAVILRKQVMITYKQSWYKSDLVLPGYFIPK